MPSFLSRSLQATDAPFEVFFFLEIHRNFPTTSAKIGVYVRHVIQRLVGDQRILDGAHKGLGLFQTLTGGHFKVEHYTRFIAFVSVCPTDPFHRYTHTSYRQDDEDKGV